MPGGKRYPTPEDAQEYADTFDDATGPTALVEKMKDSDGNPYWVVVPKPLDLGEYFKDAEEDKMNMGGAVVDELGYMHGGMPHGKRGPIKYAAGGAVRGKRFVGTF